MKLIFIHALLNHEERSIFLRALFSSVVSFEFVLEFVRMLTWNEGHVKDRMFHIIVIT